MNRQFVVTGDTVPAEPTENPEEKIIIHPPADALSPFNIKEKKDNEKTKVG